MIMSAKSKNVTLKSSQIFSHSLNFYYHGQIFWHQDSQGKNAAVIFFITVIEPKNESLNDSTKLSLAKKTTKKWAKQSFLPQASPLFGYYRDFDQDP